MLRFKILGSGSSGNAMVVEAGSANGFTRVLVDCGLPLRQLDERLALAGLSADAIDAVFITHEHSDHIGHARQFALRWRTPVWMSHGTHAAMGSPDFDGLLMRACDCASIQIKDLQIMPFTVPHDAQEPLQLVISDTSKRLGILTDLGHATPHVIEQLAGCHALILECNHDPDLLASSSYPEFLKRRVGGRFGHLSNDQAAGIATAVCHDGLKHLIAAHLSERNNRPELAIQTLARATGRDPSEIMAAHPASGTVWLQL